MKKIAVTGGSGGGGYYVIKELLSHGYECVNLDVAAPKDSQCPFIAVDLKNYETLFEALQGCDGIVHFAGNPQPDNDHFEAADRFTNNTIACFNVFNAARAIGIEKVVWASSETVFGFPFVDNLPPHVPVDENTPDAPQTGYAVSKAATERAAEMMAELYSMTIIGLRLSNILYDDETAEASYQKIPSYWDDVTNRRFNLWGYIDARDSARACRLALESDLSGAHVFSIAAKDTIMNIPSRDVMAAAMPTVEVRDSLQGRAGMMNCQKAKDMLGFEPHFTWSRVLGLDEDGSPKG